jgi:hypothetical protein
MLYWEEMGTSAYEPNIKIPSTHSEEQAERIGFGILKHLLKIAI